MATIHFLNGIGPDIENHYYQKEYRNDILVENEGKFYEVYFFTKDALEYELNKDGFFSLPGLVILDEITLKKLVDSITFLIKNDFFEQFVGYSEFSINNRFQDKWYENRGSKFSKEKLTSINIF